MTQVALSSHVQDHCHLWQIWLFCICKRLHFISSIFALHFEVNDSAPWWTYEWPHLTNIHTTQTYKWIIPGRRKGATQYIYQGELYLGVHECIKIVSENQTPDTPDWRKGSYLDPIKRWIPNTVMSRAPTNLSFDNSVCVSRDQQAENYQAQLGHCCWHKLLKLLSVVLLLHPLDLSSSHPVSHLELVLAS